MIVYKNQFYNENTGEIIVITEENGPLVTFSDGSTRMKCEVNNKIKHSTSKSREIMNRLELERIGVNL